MGLVAYKDSKTGEIILPPMYRDARPPDRSFRSRRKKRKDKNYPAGVASLEDWWRSSDFRQKFTEKLNKSSKGGPLPDQDKPHYAGLSRCWTWGGHVSKHLGYGIMASPFGNQRAHRASWAYHNEEPVPEGKLVCHRCDNRSCINPDHLFIGTHADNNADKVAKGRDRRPDRYNPRRGETTHNAKMDDYSVVSARWMHETFGFSMRSLAKYFGVTYTNMRAILLRKAWSHVK